MSEKVVKRILVIDAYRNDATLGLSQFNIISTINKKRLRIAKQYNQKLKN